MVAPLGVALANGMVALLRYFIPASGIAGRLSLSYEVDGTTVAFALLVTLLSGIAFGLAPALQASRPRLYETLKEGGRSSGGQATHHGLRHLLVVGEVAMALVLLVGAGLCVKGLQSARQIEFGFDRSNVLLADLQIGMHGYTEPRPWASTEEFGSGWASYPEWRRQRLRAGFRWGWVARRGAMTRAGGYERPPRRGHHLRVRPRISPRYFAVMKTPLLSGRDFSMEDDTAATPVAIVNEHFAQRFWPGQDPLGRRFRAQGQWRTIIGVAKAGKYNRLNEGPWPYFYLPYEQGVPDLDLNIALRTSGNPKALTQAMLRTLHELDPGVDVVRTGTLEEHTEAIFFAQRIASILLMLLGAMGVVLAAMGVYAVMAYAVAQRTQEFGVRLALGASEPDLLRLVVRKGLTLALAGTVAGLTLAIGLTRLLAGFLFGVSPFDPVTFIAVPLFLTVVTVLASYVPARRAARVDPMVALRCE